MQDWILALAGLPFAVVGLYLFAMLDGIFPPVPSESAVIALAALSVSGGHPNLVLVLVAAAAGAFTGDQLAYTVGRRVDVRRLPILCGPRGHAVLDRAEQALTHRGPSFLLAARYVPGGRVAANLMAGALHYPRRRFVGLTAVGAVSWSLFSAAIGIGAGTWLIGRPVLAIGIGIAGGIIVGLLVDRLLQQRQNRAQRLRTAPVAKSVASGQRPAGPRTRAQREPAHESQDVRGPGRTPSSTLLGDRDISAT